MIVLISLFGLLLIAAGIMLISNPDLLFNFLERYSGHPGLYIGAISVRIILGMLLIWFAGLSRFPLTITVIGWIAILAAAVLATLGRKRFARLMSRIVIVFKPYGRPAGIFAVVFGAFLMIAFT